MEYDGSSSCFSEIAICDGPLVFFKFKHFVSSVGIYYLIPWKFDISLSKSDRGKS